MKRMKTSLGVVLLVTMVLFVMPTMGMAQDDDDDAGDVGGAAVGSGGAGGTGGTGGGSAPVEAADTAFDADRKPVLDPFRVLIVPKKPVAPPVVHTPIVQTNQGPPPIPPLQVNLTAIAGEDPNFVAVIEFKGSDYIVEKGWEAPDKSFLVRTIYADKIEVFYNKDKSVKTFFFQP